MNKWEGEVQKSLLASEEAAIKELEKQYKKALNDINEKVKLFDSDIKLLQEAINADGLDDAAKAVLISQQRSKVYQKQYQQALQGQVSGILDNLHGAEYATIEKYLKECYTDGYIGTMYDIAHQGIPVIMPIDQAAVVKAVLTDSKVSKGLYNALGVNVSKLKKTITQEVSRGIATGLSYNDIARNISNAAKAPLSRAKTIARTEGHRIQATSTADAQKAAKAKGADVVKQWDATLDGKTRDSHRQVDGEIRELDETFSNGLKQPGDSAGGAAEVVNCRCALLTRARWALDEDELKTLEDRAKYFGLDKTKNFDAFKKKYLSGAEAVQKEIKTVDDISKQATEKLLDAYDDRRKHFNLNETTAAELRAMPNNPFTANYTGLSVETAEAFSDTIARLSDQYYTGFTKIEVGDARKLMGVQSFAMTSHQNLVDQKTLTINPLKTKDFNKMVERIDELQRKGYAVKLVEGKTGQYIPTHEFAHSLMDMKTPLKNYVGMDVRMMKKARSEIDDVFTKYKAETEALEQAFKKAESKLLTISPTDDFDKIRAEALEAKAKLNAVKISKYSLENSDEFLAEAFTQYHIGATRSPYSDDVMAVVNKYFQKPLEKSTESDIIGLEKGILTHRKVSAAGREIVNQATYNKVTKPVIKKGGMIVTATDDNDWLRYLDERGATAVTIGDSIILRPDATTTEVLEEVFHFNQNRSGLNLQYSDTQRKIMNEIEAQEYLISVADKYKIPQAEREETKALLESYKKQMEELKKAGEWDD